MQLSAIDLNLLVALRALLETQSVKEAARKVSLSPSAMSHALARLREVLGDPILVRSGRGLALTPRGERLRPRVASLLDETERLFANVERVDPAHLQRTFSLGTNDYVERVVLLRFSQHLAIRAPGVDLHSRRCVSTVDELHAGSHEIVIGTIPPLPPDLVSEVLFEDRYVCLMRAGHPASKRTLTARRFSKLGHVLVSPRGAPGGVVDRRLEELGLTRRVARTVATFSVAPHLVRTSDYVLTLAERLARPVAKDLGLVVVMAPITVEFEIGMIWHRRMLGDPAHEWFRTELAGLAAQLA